MLCRSLTICRLIRNARGFPAIFGVACSAVSAAVAAVYEASCGAMRLVAVLKWLDVAPHGIGSTVVALIFSMAKREVTFLSGTAAIRRL